MDKKLHGLILLIMHFPQGPGRGMFAPANDTCINHEIPSKEDEGLGWAMKRNNVARGHIVFIQTHLKATRGKCNFRPGQRCEQQVPHDKAILQIRIHTVVLLSANLMLHCICKAKPFESLTYARKIRIGHLLLQIVLINALGESARGTKILLIVKTSREAYSG